MAVQGKPRISTRLVAKRTALGDIANKVANGPSKIEEKGNKEKSKTVSGRGRPAGSKKEAICAKEVENEEKVEEVEKVLSEEVKVPWNVNDVDTPELHNPQLCGEYAPYIYAYLRQLEEGLVIRKDFLKGCPINGKMRAVLVDWLVEVHAQFQLLQETLYMTVYIVDRYLQSEGLTLKRNQLQLVGVSSMFVASKVEEICPPELNDFVFITDSAYTPEDVKKMELKILQTLNFQVSRPLALHFLRRNSKAGDVDMTQHVLAKYLMEVCLPEYSMAQLPPSLMAASALLLSLRILQPKDRFSSLWTPSLVYYSSYSIKQLMSTMNKIGVVVKKVHGSDSTTMAVTNKYKGRKYLQVSQLACLKGEVIEKLALKDFTDL